MAMLEERVVEKAHRQAVSAPIEDVTSFLQDLLASRRLVAYIAAVQDTKTVARWANGEVREVRHKSVKRLRTAYEIAQLLTQFNSPQIVQAWFIGLNPQLDDVSPAEAIHEGQLKEALYAARAFVAGG